MRRIIISVTALALVLALLAGCSGSALPESITELVPERIAGLLPERIAALLPGGETEAGEEGFVIYRLSAATKETGDLLCTEPYPLTGGTASDLAAVLSALASESTDPAMRSAMLPGVTIEGFGFQNGIVTLTLSSGYLDLPAMDRTEIAFCAALTLCQLEGVDSVTILSGGQVVYSALSKEEALLSASDMEPYVRRLRLYFADEDGRWLISEYHTLAADATDSPERYVVEELLRGPHSLELYSAIPQGTVLLSCETRDGVCTVDLSSAFITGRPLSAAGERLAVYSLVNSLTTLADVDSVRILVEGQSVGQYVYRSLSDPLERWEDSIGPVPETQFEADLYLPVPAEDVLAALPYRINETGASHATAVLHRLLTAAEPGFRAVFPESVTENGLYLDEGLCTVDLPESFFAGIPAEERYLAVQSVAATLCALEEISSVTLAINGEPAVYEDTDWSGPWSDFSEIEVY